MLRLFVKEYMIKKGLKAKPKVLTDMGIPFNTAKEILKGNTKSIKHEILELLCMRLNCSVEDLYDYKPEPHRRVAENHPMYKLYRPLAPLSPSDIIKDFNPEQLDETIRIVDKMRKESRGE